MNLFPSPRHAGSVSLILSLQTAIVLPQFHINHDDLFETVLPIAIKPTTISYCKLLSGFKRYKLHHVKHTKGGSVPDKMIPEQAQQEETSVKKYNINKYVLSSWG